MQTEAQKRAKDRYTKANVVQKTIRFYPTERDLLAWLDAHGEPFATYCKRLIREDMERHEG